MIHVLIRSPGAFLKYVALLPINVALIMASWFLSPFLALYSVIAGRSVLPSLLQNFSTLDDNLDGGQHQQPDIYPAGVTGRKLWWQRTCWICRNPAQGWQARVLGYKDVGRTITGSSDLSSANWDLPGAMYWETVQAANGKKYFCYRKNIGFGKKYFKFWIGWHYQAKNGIDHHYKFQLPALQ